MPGPSRPFGSHWYQGSNARHRSSLCYGKAYNLFQSYRAVIKAQMPGTTVAQKLNQRTTPQPGGNRLRSPFCVPFWGSKKEQKEN